MGASVRGVHLPDLTHHTCHTVSDSKPVAPHDPPLRRSPVRRNILAGLAVALRSDPPAQTRLTNGSGAIVSPPPKTDVSRPTPRTQVTFHRTQPSGTSQRPHPVTPASRLRRSSAHRTSRRHNRTAQPKTRHLHFRPSSRASSDQLAISRPSCRARSAASRPTRLKQCRRLGV